MALLENLSFGLLRTNPKLTTNVKLIVDSSNNMYLESFEDVPNLNDINLKNYKVYPNGNYEWDVWRFWKNGKFPSKFAYQVWSKNSNLNIQSDYNAQYEMTYCAGTSYINSLNYSEEFGIFSPLYLNKNIPTKFVIFKLPKPLSDNNTIENFNQAILNQSEIIKVFDLSETSPVGKYIRNINKVDPLLINWTSDKPSYYRGISYNNGGYVEIATNIYKDLYVIDKSIIEFEHFITQGFENNNVICSNIINLQFLFDDINAKDFEINRYYGLYVDEFNENEIQLTYKNNNTFSILSGIVPDKESVETTPSIWYLKNDKDLIKLNTNEDLKENEISLAKTDFNVEQFPKFKNPSLIIKTKDLNTKGRSHIIFEITSTPVNGDWYRISVDNSSYQVTASSTHASLTKPRSSYKTLFSIRGTNSDVAFAMASAIRNIKSRKFFSAVAVDNKVYVFAVHPGQYYNKFIVKRNLNILQNPIVLTSNDGNWLGGSDKPAERVAIPLEYVNLLNTNKSIYWIKTLSGYAQFTYISAYLDQDVKDANFNIIAFNNVKEYANLTVKDDSIYRNERGEIFIYELTKYQIGRFSIYPIKDFDTNYFSTKYGLDLDVIYDYYNDINSQSQNYHSYKTQTPAKNFTGFVSLWDIDNKTTGDISLIDCEYNRLNENYIKELSIESRLTPWISKWSKNGKNVRELPYRLTNSEAFGLHNFSPSFIVKDPNPQYFTHEWYYLGEYPTYMNINQRLLSYSYFDNKFNVNNLYDNTYDYFTQYFTVENISGIDVPTQLRYSYFSKGNNINYASTFFRGINLFIKERSENLIDVNYNLNSLSFQKSFSYNDYKFSAILVPEENDNNPTFSIEFIENKHWKTLTLVIKINLKLSLNGFLYKNESQILDHFILYTIQSNFNANDGSNVYTDINISGYIDLINSKPDLTNSQHYIIKGIGTKFLEEINLNKFGSFNTLSNNFNSSLSTVQIDVIKVIDNSTLIGKISSSFNIQNISDNISKRIEWIYEEGGYNVFNKNIQNISFANIVELVNEGNSIVNYSSINLDGSITTNEYVVEFEKPDLFIKSSYIDYQKDLDKPTNYTSNDIGYVLKYSDKINLLPIDRYSGEYLPLFTDVITFNNKNLDESFKNFNLRFNVEDSTFGTIKNMYYQKINQEIPEKILNISKNFKPVYPLINQIAIDKKDFYIFKSNWESDYYQKHLNEKDYINVNGTLTSNEIPSFLGSKLMSLPNSIKIETMNSILSNLVTENELMLNDISLTYFITNGTLTLNVLLEKLLIRKLIELGIGNYITPYITVNIITEKTIDEFIYNYIKKNILNRLTIGSIKLFIYESNIDMKYPDLNTSIDDFTKLKLGYVIKKDYRLIKSQTSNFDFTLNYTFNTGKYKIFSSALSIEIIKK